MSQNTPAPSYSSPPQKTPYDFLDENRQNAKKSLLPAGLTFRHKLLLLIGAATAMLIIMSLVGSLFLGNGGGNTEQLKELAKQQNELVRVADIGTRKARSSAAMNLAVTAKSTIESDQRATIGYITSQKEKLPAKELQMNKNAKTDELLTRADQANQFDEVFIKTIHEQLTIYRADVKKAYDEASGKKLKALLSDNYNHVSALLPSKQ